MHGRDFRDPASVQCRPSADGISKVRDLHLRGACVGAIVVLLSCMAPVLAPAPPHASAAVGGSSSASGYWLVASDGGIFPYGDAAFYGSTGGMMLNRPVVGMAATPDGRGYWLVASDGGIFPYGDAAFYGSTGGMMLNRPVVGMAATPDGRGYWLVASDGGIFPYGDAAFYGSTGGMMLNRPIVGMAATPDGRGYWLVASDGGIFPYGDAAFYGSTGGMMLNRPIVGMAATPDGRGYWLVASDGGIFPYGDAAFYGSTGGMMLNRPVVGMAATPDGRGYWLVASDGGIFPYGDAAFYGSTGGMMLNRPVVGMAVPSSSMAGTSPPVGSTTTTTPEQGSASQSGAMSPPAGYTSQQRIFDDQFSGTTLDSSKWVTYLGAAGAVWNNFGELPLPYSADNSVANGGPGDDITMYSPSQVSVDNGLTLTAQRNTNQYASTYPWISGVVTTEGKFTMPAGDWYVQVKAQMPDTSQGIWPAIWFLCGVSCPDDNELDGYGGGFLVGSDNPNELMTSDFFADQGQQQSTNNIGTDVSAGYNVYGVQFIPGQSITAYFNGQQVWQVLASSGVTIASEPYQLMMELQVAGSPTSSWHTAANSNTPTSSMKIADVQVYS